MAFLRAFSDIDVVCENKIPINDGEQYEVAKKLFEEDDRIMYFYYFSDWADENKRFYTYPITRSDADYMTKNQK